MNSPMIGFRRSKQRQSDESFVWGQFSRETPMIADHMDCSVLEQHDPSGRRLRNRLIVAKAIAWIAIIALIHLVLF
jgi:hypothetical protein